MNRRIILLFFMFIASALAFSALVPLYFLTLTSLHYTSPVPVSSPIVVTGSFESLPDSWVGRRVIYQGIMHCPRTPTPFGCVPFNCSLSVQSNSKTIGVLWDKPDFSLNLRSVVVIGVVKTGEVRSIWPHWLLDERIGSINYIEAELVEQYPS